MTFTKVLLTCVPNLQLGRVKRNTLSVPFADDSASSHSSARDILACTSRCSMASEIGMVKLFYSPIDVNGKLARGLKPLYMNMESFPCRSETRPLHYRTSYSTTKMPQVLHVSITFLNVLVSHYTASIPRDVPRNVRYMDRSNLTDGKIQRPELLFKGTSDHRVE